MLSGSLRSMCRRGFCSCSRERGGVSSLHVTTCHAAVAVWRADAGKRQYLFCILKGCGFCVCYVV